MKKTELRKLGKEIAAGILKGALEGDVMHEALERRELKLNDNDAAYTSQVIWDLIEKLEKES